ncbi:hypothetical protein [Paludibaculum fermentans]|uniref:Uncharacterized protein n=1 Tax=Paludibaculum fermentans TaxID=1473598 RepID=A0A7S7SJ38_PALFE|nr:hypothetical protein [Paludibaculum fermentans]QOY85585.1 hypothetical protein IRI77_22490 [Paludibaculum fermentans]
MPTLSNPQDLLPLLGSVATADDPIASLEKRGSVFSPSLKSNLQPRRVVKPAQRLAWNQAAAKAGRITYTAGKHPQIAPRALGQGEYEFSAGLKTSAANEVLAGLLASGTIPNTVFLDEILSSGEIDLLQGAFVVDKPGGRISRFQVTAPPTIALLRDGFDRVALTIPFRLNFERISHIVTGDLRTVVTFATGRLRLSVGLVTKIVPVSVAARNLEIQLDLSNSTDARLELDANSPVKRVNPPPPDQADGFAILLQNALQQKLAATLRMTISASIPLPIGKLEIHETALLTRGDAILVGIKVQGTPSPGNPATLTALFPNTDTNFFTRVHDSVLRLIVQSAARSGQLTAIAKQTHPDAVIDSADIAFGNGTIQMITTGKIVDLCPLGVDLGFTTTTTLTITLEGTRIRVQKDTNNDLDNTDVILCVITSLGLALLAALSVILTQGLSLASGFAAGFALGVVGVLSVMMEFDSNDFALVLGDGGDNKPTFIELDFPIPGTDLLPTLTGTFIRLDESTMLIAAHLSTRADNLNTYFYVQFLEPDSLGIARAMRGVTVRLMDRDSPAPAGDDVVMPAPTTTHSSHHLPTGTISTTIKTTYERTSDETVQTATTDHAGRIRIYIPRNKLASKAGNKVVQTTRLNVDTDKETTGTIRTPVSEARPDFYFRVTRPNGTIVDTLQIPAGFFLNFQSARIGTPTQPRVISFGGSGGVIVASKAASS